MSKTPTPEIQPRDETMPPVIPADVNRAVLDSILLRLWRVHPMASTELALEVIDGPYKGVVFTWGQFEASTKKTEDGMTPIHFTTRIFVSPEGFKQDAAWDAWCSEVMLAWMAHTATTNYQQLISVPGARSTRKGIPGVH